MRRLAFTDLGTVDAASWGGLCEALAPDDGARLVAARLSGAVLGLGRWQDPALTLSDAALAKPWSRRSSGGRAIVLGEGQLAVALVVPHRSWLEPDPAAALPTARFLNRAVRGLLSALARVGVSASHFGRDFVTWHGGQGPYVSFDVRASGAAIFEAVIPAEAHWWPSRGLLAREPRALGRGFPEPAMAPELAGLESSRWLRALVDGYAERFPVECVASSEPMHAAPVPECELGSNRSERLEIAAGSLVAGVALDQGRIARIVLSGELLADSAGIARLNARLRGERPEYATFAAALDEVYSDPAHALVGVTELASVAKALAEAANRG